MRDREDKSVRGKKLYSSYRHWSERNGFKPKSSNAVAEDWRRLGFESGRDKQGVIWYGLEVTDAVPSLGGFGG